MKIHITAPPNCDRPLVRRIKGRITRNHSEVNTTPYVDTGGNTEILALYTGFYRECVEKDVMACSGRISRIARPLAGKVVILDLDHVLGAYEMYNPKFFNWDHYADMGFKNADVNPETMGPRYVRDPEAYLIGMQNFLDQCIVELDTIFKDYHLIYLKNTYVLHEAMKYMTQSAYGDLTLMKLDTDHDFYVKYQKSHVLSMNEKDISIGIPVENEWAKEQKLYKSEGYEFLTEDNTYKKILELGMLP